MKKNGGDLHEKMVVTEEIEEKGNITKFDIIHLDNKDFEYGAPTLWSAFDSTIGKLICDSIEKRSIDIILANATEQEVKDWAENKNREKILAKYRVNFGRKALKDLFRLKTFLFNSNSKLLQHFCYEVANAGSLDDTYNSLGSFSWNGKRIFPMSYPHLSYNPFDQLHFRCPNAQSVRNRYRMLMELYKSSGGGKTLSIACGSAQALVHAIHDLKNEGRHENIHLTLTDISEVSLDRARTRVQEAGIAELTDFRKVSFKGLMTEFKDEKFDVIEACGILDYIPDFLAVELIKIALNALTENGVIFFSNMAETRHAVTLRRMFNWEITYRTPAYFARLIHNAGGKNIKVFMEPWGIQPIASATKR